MIERRFAGRRKGDMMVGEKHMDRPQKMNFHWVHKENNRMYWCGCFHGFRINGEEKHFGIQKGRKAAMKWKKSFHFRIHWDRYELAPGLHD